MTKPFNIHDWQAKQRLAENDEYQKRQDALTPGKNPDAFYGDGSLDKLRNSDALGSAGSDKRSGQIIGDILQLIEDNQIDPMDVMEEIAQRFNINFDFNGGAPGMTKYGDKMPGPGRGLEEHHAGDYNPGFLKQTISTFLDKLKKKTNEGPDYETVEKIMEKHFSAKNENVTFNAGSGEGYMTPNAFKKKKKK